MTNPINQKGVYLWKKSGIFNNKNIFLDGNERLNQTYVLGTQNSWKNKILLNLMIQDMHNWNWICVIDEYWEYTEQLLKFIPKERAKDVIYFDAGNENRPMGLNLYEIDSLDEANRVVEYATEMFLKMFWPEIFWPRIQEYFKYSSLAILEDFEDRPTILDVVRMFIDDSYKEYKLAKVTNPIVLSRRERTYNTMGDREKSEIIPYFSSKFVTFQTNKIIRNIIWQTISAFDLNDAINNKKIVLVNLAKDKLWELSESLLWTILVYKIKLALTKRAYLPKEDKNPFFLYINNFQNILSTPYWDYLKKAKENQIWITLIHDYINQLVWIDQINPKNKEKDIQDIMNSTWNICIFNSFSTDAELFENELSIPKKAIKNLKENQFFYINKTDKKPFKINWYNNYFVNPIETLIPILKEYSEKKYWRQKDYIEAEFCAKYWINVEIKKINEEGKEPKIILVRKPEKKEKKISKKKTTKKWA